MILAQLSDLHVTRRGTWVSGRVDTAVFLERALAWLNRLSTPPDALLLTGDLVDGGSAEEYAYLRELLAPLLMPVYMIPGNHDGREALRSVFADAAWMPRSGPIHYAIDDHPVRIIALDSHVPGEPHGELDDAQLAWLEARLAEDTGKPTVVMVHHPPFVTGIEFMDTIRLMRGADELGAIVERHPQVERLLCGHVHRAMEIRWRGTLLMTAPSSAHQIVLEFDPDAPEGFTFEPPGVRLHLWTGAELVTHNACIGDYPGPYPF
jgi:Icc protein